MSNTHTTDWISVSNGESSGFFPDDHTDINNTEVQFRGHAEYINSRSERLSRIGEITDRTIFLELEEQLHEDQTEWEFETVIHDVSGDMTIGWFHRFPENLSVFSTNVWYDFEDNVEVNGGESIGKLIVDDEHVTTAEDRFWPGQPGEEYESYIQIKHVSSPGSVTIEQIVRDPDSGNNITNRETITYDGTTSWTRSATFPQIDNFESARIDPDIGNGNFRFAAPLSSYHIFNSPNTNVNFTMSTPNGEVDIEKEYTNVRNEEPLDFTERITQDVRGEELEYSIDVDGSPIFVSINQIEVYGEELDEKSESPTISDGETTVTVDSLTDDETSDWKYYEHSDEGAESIPYTVSVGGIREVDIRFRYDYELPAPDVVSTALIGTEGTTIQLPLVDPTDDALENNHLISYVDNEILAADLVDTDDPDASQVRVYIPGEGVFAWRNLIQ